MSVRALVLSERRAAGDTINAIAQAEAAGIEEDT